MTAHWDQRALGAAVRSGWYEEYHPYGTTAWQAPSLTTVSLKRYKYTGMERDEETGLQRHGVRYYATWLGRWTSADPIGLGDGVNRYAYCHGGPVGGRDSTGMDTWDEVGTLPRASPVTGADEQPGTVLVLHLDGSREHLTASELDARARAVVDRIVFGNQSSVLLSAIGIEKTVGPDGTIGMRLARVPDDVAQHTQAEVTLALEDAAHSGVGLSVLEALVEAPASVMVAQTSGDPFKISSESGVIGAAKWQLVAFNPDLSRADFATEAGEIDPAWDLTDREIRSVALVHELLHAFRGRSKTKALEFADPFGGREVLDVTQASGVELSVKPLAIGEKQVTGLYAYSTEYFSENRFRDERGLPRRLRYGEH